MKLTESILKYSTEPQEFEELCTSCRKSYFPNYIIIDMHNGQPWNTGVTYNRKVNFHTGRTRKNISEKKINVFSRMATFNKLAI